MIWIFKELSTRTPRTIKLTMINAHYEQSYYSRYFGVDIYARSGINSEQVLCECHQ